MRKRIRQIARGKFEYAKPILTFSEEFLDLQITEDKDESGSFTISTNNDEILRGVVYCTEPRMECLTPQFEGAEIRIRYQFHSRGLVEGDKVEGAFIIVCNQSEYSLSFCAIISKRYPTTSIGVIHNLYDFACLAKENWDEAFQLFYHKNFTNVINSNEVKELMIYRGMVSSKPSNQNLEEFLVGIKKKEVVKITTDKTEAVYYDITNSISETCNIKKSGWGYIEINISSDSEFIELPQTRLVTDDFIGSTPKKRTAPVIKARMQSDRPITICAGVGTTLNPNYWYYDMTNPAEVAQCRFSWNWELFDESSRYAIGPYPNRNTPYCEYDYPKPPENCNSAKTLIVESNSDCSKLYNRGWKSITVNEGLCNSMTGDINIYNNPCLESIVIKKNSLKNSNGLYIFRNPQLSSIVVETGDWDTSACRSVRSLTLSSIFYLMSI